MAKQVYILCNIETISPEHDADTILRQLSSHYNHQILGDDPDFYAMTSGEVHFGSADEQLVIERAANQNPYVRMNLKQAMEQLDPVTCDLDTMRTYKLANAAMEADNRPTPASCRLAFNLIADDPVLPDRTTWEFQTVLTDQQVQHIIEHPDAYALVELSIK